MKTLYSVNQLYLPSSLESKKNFNIFVASKQDDNRIKKLKTGCHSVNEMQVINHLALRDHSGFSRDFIGFHD